MSSLRQYPKSTIHSDTLKLSTKAMMQRNDAMLTSAGLFLG